MRRTFFLRTLTTLSLLISLMIYALPAGAQGLLPNSKQTFLDSNGAPLASGTVEFFTPGTSVHKNTYSDSALTVLNANPLTLDSAGRAIVWGNGSYREVVKDSAGNTIWDATTSVLPQQGAAYVQTNAALTALSTANFSQVVRLGVTTVNDAPPVTFYASGSACSLNAGNGDTGSQVRSADSKCWIAQYGPEGADLREWGVVCDGATSTGNAAAVNKALVSAVSPLNVPQLTCVLDNTITVSANGTVLQGPGRYAGAVLKAANSVSASELITISATSDVTLKGFEVNGNKANATLSLACVDNTSTTHLYVDLYAHDCTKHDIYLAGSYFSVYGEYDNTGTGSGVAVCGGNTTSDHFTVDVITNNTGAAGVTCIGVGTEGSIKVVCSLAGQDSGAADCATGYNKDISYLDWNVVCNSSGNHCAHVGGSVVHAKIIASNPTLSGLFVGSLYQETDGTVTVTGTSVVGSGGQAWTQCTHTCQSGAGNDNAAVVIGGTSCNVDHVTDDTHLTLTSACFSNGAGQAYTLQWYGTSTLISADVTSNNSGSGAQSGIQAWYCDRCTFNGDSYASLGTGILCFTCINTTVNASSFEATITGTNIEGGIPYSTGTVTTTGGSAVVTGSGTSWLSTVAPGDVIRVGTDTVRGTVLTVDSNTQITLTAAYGGTIGVGQSYRIAEISKRVHVNGDTNSTSTGNGTTFTDCFYCYTSGGSSSNGTVSGPAYGYVDAGVSFNDLFSGLAEDNRTAATDIFSTSWYTGKP